MELYEYEFHCIGCGKPVTVWSHDYPDRCPVNTAHAIDPASIVILQSMSEKEVVTQLEKDDKELVLASIEGAFEGDTCELSIRIPGSVGELHGRFIAGGYGFTDQFGWGDRVKDIKVVDTDFGWAGIAYPATPHEAGIPGTEGMTWAQVMPDGVEMGSYVDKECEESEQGWRMWCDEGNQGGVDIDPLGGFGKLPSATDMVIVIEKVSGNPATKAAVNLWWGKKK